MKGKLIHDIMNADKEICRIYEGPGPGYQIIYIQKLLVEPQRNFQGNFETNC